MKTFAKQSFFLMALLCLTRSGMSQLENVKRDFKAISDNYIALNKLSMTVIYKVYTDETNNPVETQTGFYRLENGKVNTKAFNIETVYSNKLRVIVDYDSRTIVIDSVRTITGTPKNIPDLYLDTLYMAFKTVNISMKDSLQKKYEFVYSDGQFSKTEVYVNVSTKFITKIVTYFADNMEISDGVFKQVRSEVEFSNITTDPTFTTDFSISRFVTRSGMTFTLKPQYSGYQLIKAL